MKHIVKTEYKPLEAGQKSLFECKDVLSDSMPKREEKDGMPNWFWKLAQECRAEVTG